MGLGLPRGAMVATLAALYEFTEGYSPPPAGRGAGSQPTRDQGWGTAPGLCDFCPTCPSRLLWTPLL